MKTSRSLQQYYRDEATLDDNDNIIDFRANNNNNVSFKFKQQITGKIGNGSTKYVEIMVPVKYLSNFSKTLEMLLINCQIYPQLIWSKKCFIVAGTAANQRPVFKVTDAKLYVSVGIWF